MKFKKGSAEAKAFMKKLRAARTKGKKALSAAGDYAKFELSTIKALSKLLKKPLKDTQKVVNTNSKLLDIIGNAFNSKKTPLATAKILKEELIEKVKVSPTNAFIQLLNKLPKKETTTKASFPMKLPAQVTIGSLKNNFIFEYKVSSGGKYYVSSNLYLRGLGIKQIGNGSDHKRGLRTYLLTNNALKKVQRLFGKENTTYIESDY